MSVSADESRDRGMKEATSETLRFWKEFMEGEPGLLALPRDFAPPTVRSGRIGRVPVRIPDRLAGSLESLCRRQRTALFQGLLAGFAALLARYTGDAEVVIGVPFHIREREKMRNGSRGFSVLPVRLLVCNASNFRELMQQTHQTVRRVSPYADLPLQCLVRKICTESDAGFHLPFQVGFELERISFGSQDSVLAGERTRPVDLWLHLEEHQQRLDGWLEFDEDLYRSDTALRFTEQLVYMLAQAVKFPSRPLGSLPLQSSKQLRKQVLGWNQTHRVLSFAALTVQEAIARQAQLFPSAIAVVSPTGVTSYAELDRNSRALARCLKGAGIGPEVPVGVCGSRSATIVTAVLGVLSAGGVYVPLDPAYPAERLAFMIRDAGIETVLLQPGTNVALPSCVRIIELTPRLFEQTDTDIPLPPVLPESLAYIIYTSGSSGFPKGVMVSHAALSNTLGWLQDTLHLTSHDVVAHKTSISFTDSLWEFLWPLLAGSKLAVIEEHVSRFPRLLIQRMRQHNVTVTQFVPAQMRLFLNELNSVTNPDPLPHLRWVFNGGEALPPSLARAWYCSFPRTRIANAYGMTESAIYGTNCVIEPRAGEPTVLVGRPIANERAYILDGDDHLCPPLCSGEIHLSGTSLARGYLNRPDLTAERFVPDPFGTPGSRMYRTGDLGRHMANGQITCSGRLDRQVKVRGARVELGEVEVQLARHPNVRQVVAIAKRLAEDHQIIAYYTYELADPGPRELHRFLSHNLPSFMIPSHLVPMEVFPLNPNGKVDRKHLVLPE
jgi:amino acid adenylation domain-containing protein